MYGLDFTECLRLHNDSNLSKNMIRKPYFVFSLFCSSEKFQIYSLFRSIQIMTNFVENFINFSDEIIIILVYYHSYIVTLLRYYFHNNVTSYIPAMTCHNYYNFTYFSTLKHVIIQSIIFNNAFYSIEIFQTCFFYFNMF